jgi:hypothetical protein
VKGFKKCSVSSTADGTDDDMLWNGSKDGNVESEYEEYEDTDCEDGNSNTD